MSVLRERKVVFAAGGVSHSIFIDNTGAVFTCGKGRGLLGHRDMKIKTVPTKVQSLEVTIINNQLFLFPSDRDDIMSVIIL